MISKIIAEPQLEIKLYKTEANVIIDALKDADSPSKYVNETVQEFIKILNKINEFEIKL